MVAGRAATPNSPLVPLWCPSGTPLVLLWSSGALVLWDSGTLGLRYSSGALSGALSGFWLFPVPRPRRSPHRYSEPAQLRAPRGAGEETGSSPGHTCPLTEAHGNCSPRASSYSPRTMHLGAEQQPPTAPATEAAHPAFSGFPSCFSAAVFPLQRQTPASGGGSKPCAGRAPRTRTRGEQPRREPPGTSVDQRRVSNSSLLLSRLVSSLLLP
ncbi:hypothetical protein NDU88_004725 [Pleurodeles waltl]|uniref:Uncharacterized protein n=1 Tax=Pleurodeles waltl TaxID=8319 RepID=A0AAV7NNH3_PLEWA|nr:hypothetical protein NDU88_004725 [Pleurodeles waltl]